MSVSGSLLASFPALEAVFADLPSPLDQTTDVPVGQGNPFTPPVVTTLFSDEMIDGPYDLWTMRTKYRWFEGVEIMPVAAPPSGSGGQNGIGVLPIPGAIYGRQAARIIRNHAPFGVMAVYWAARRRALKPTIPLPVVNDNAVFKEMEMDVGPAAVLDDNSLIFAWSAVFLFLLKKPVWLLDGLNAGRSPADTRQVSDNAVSQSQFQKLY